MHHQQTHFQLIDSHCHLDFAPFSLESSTVRLGYKAAGVCCVIVPAVAANRFQTIIDLTQEDESVYGALGLHPLFAHTQNDLNRLNQQLSQKEADRIVAIGEIGLDPFSEYADLPTQRDYFMAQCAIANQWQLPIICHTRRTQNELLRCLKQAKVAQCGVIHGFSGSYEQAMQFIDLGYFIGVGGTITYPRAQKTRAAIQKIPIESILLETDAPDMPLLGRQGQPNRPEYLKEILDSLASLRSMDREAVMCHCYDNTLRCFPKLQSDVN